MTHFCKDCKHARGDDVMSLVCESPNNYVTTFDEARYLVTGIEQPDHIVKRGATCAALRLRRDAETLKTVCGPDGKWFEPKET